MEVRLICPFFGVQSLCTLVRGAFSTVKFRGVSTEDLITHFNVREISDFMCGSGTTKAAADKLGVRSNIYDLHSGFDMLHHDIKERPEMIFWHPPYHSIITYSDVMYSASQVQQQYGYDPKLSDLSRIQSWDEFVKTLNYCMMKQFCALEKGGRMAVLVGDIKKRGKLYSMAMELVKPGTLENVIIKVQHNCFSDRTSYSGKFIPIQHEYLLLIRKDAALLYPLLMTHSRECDIRDMKNSTWKDILADAMEDFRGEAELEQIYAKVEAHSRTQTQQHWKEKIRQTLQVHPDIFVNPRRGVWTPKKFAA